MSTTADAIEPGACSTIQIGDLPGPDGVTSLREAVCAANNEAGADRIILGANTYALTIAGAGEDANATGDLDILDDLTIVGLNPTSTIINGGGIDRVLHIPGTAALVTVDNVTVTGGAAGDGGGISNSGSLTVTESAISGNSVTDYGGGIFNEGELTLSQSTVSGNEADYGGGLYNVRNQPQFGGVATLVNSTISGNEALEGGGIYADYGSATHLTHVTISNNRATDGDAGGVYVTGNGDFPSSLDAVNTIIAHQAEGVDCTDASDYSVIVSNGHNLESGTSCGFAATGDGDIQNGDAVLGPLQDNGGPTATHALLVGSDAVDKISDCDAHLAVLEDQRSVARPQGAECDIGAYEAQPGSITIIKAADPADGTDFTFTLSGADLDPVAFDLMWGKGVNGGTGPEFCTGSTCSDGALGLTAGEFFEPHRIVTDALGYTYVSDYYIGRVQKFDENGNFVLMWGKGVNGGSGPEICSTPPCTIGGGGTLGGEFDNAQGIAVDGAGNVYVADAY
ncbi:MAG: hypothetical protein KDE20_18245, partial [Caldilineaceae bacterium]|nr:hypothetical protein [Caldilineaceae bacterium]